MVSEASLTADSFLPEDGSGVVVGLQDLAELESACLATAVGDVLLFNFNTCQVRNVLFFEVICFSFMRVLTTTAVFYSWSASAAWIVVSPR